MAIVGFMPLVDPLKLPAGVGVTSHVLDATNDEIAIVTSAPAELDITHVAVHCPSGAGSLPIYSAALYEVDSSGNPTDSTIAGTAGGQFGPVVGQLAICELFDPVSLTAGQQFAIRIKHSSGTINASNYAAFNVVAPALGGLSLLTPRAMIRTAGTWSTLAGIPLIAPMYDDATLLEGFACVSNLVSHATWNTSSSDVSRGNKWTANYSGRIAGFNIAGDYGTAWNFNLTVYVNNVLTVDFAVDVSSLLNDPSGSSLGFIPCQVSFSAGDVIRFVMTPIVPATNPTASAHWTFPSQAAMTAFANAQLCGTTGTTVPVWTDYNSGGNGFRLYPIFPVIDLITTGGGHLVGSSLVR